MKSPFTSNQKLKKWRLNRMEYRNPQDLRPHPISVKLYGENHIDDLIESIREFGILTPLTITNDNKIISGHRRWRSALILELDTVPVDIKTYEDELAEKRGILEYNRQREKTFSQKMNEADLLKDIVAEEARQRALNNLQQYRDTPSSVSDASGETADIVGQSVGIGKADTYRRANKVWQEAKQGNPIAQQLVTQLDKGNTSIKKAHRIITSKEKEAERNNNRKLITNTEVAPDIQLGDFHNLIKTIKDDSIDLILTDPPYPKEFLPLWTDLAKEAKRVLKPGSFLIAYSGQVFLPQVLNMLLEHLDYYWLGMLYHQGVTGQRFEVNMWNRAKPILFFQKPPHTKQTEWLEDVIVSEKPDKELHDWGQNVKPLIKLLEHFSKPNDIILDPFMGGGATIEACIETKRKVIGYEIDKEQFRLVKERLNG